MRNIAAAVVSLAMLMSPLAEQVRACTSFVMDTPEGPVFGTNLDLFIPGDGLVMVNRRGVEKQSYRTGTTGERLRWTSEYGSVTFNLAGREYAWGGMNEAGLVVSTMQLAAGEYPPPDERPSLFDGNWAQYVLDACGSVEDVLQTDALVTVRGQGYTSHYLIADANGRALIVEFLDGKSVFHTDAEMPVKAMANMRYDRSAWAYEHGGTRWWWSNPGQSAERVAACEARTASFDAARDTSAVDYAFGTLLYYVAAPHTRWNIVYDIAGRQIWYRTDQSPAYKHIALEAFDFSCEAPKLMMDVNTPHEGDVAERFTPYDPDVNLTAFRTFCDRYGIQVGEEDARALTGFFDGFECAR